MFQNKTESHPLLYPPDLPAAVAFGMQNPFENKTEKHLYGGLNANEDDSDDHEDDGDDISCDELIDGKILLKMCYENKTNKRSLSVRKEERA